jgi:hypothetical protein
MDKCSIFIASSGRTLLLAEKLGEELRRNEFSEATLWSEESRRHPGTTIIEMLENAAERIDFAVIILARDDVMVKETGDTLKARDNCVFEAGLFIRALGRERCFLVNSVEQRDLPSDLGGIITLQFKEPPDLCDRDACAKAIQSVSAEIKDVVARSGIAKRRLLSGTELMAREKLQKKGGKLDEDQVVVTAIQPLEVSYEPALQVRQNIDDGVRYIYFFQGNPNGAERICRLLQMLLLAPIFAESNDSEKKPHNFQYRRSAVEKEQNRNKIMQDLKKICALESLKIYFLPAAPILQYCIHNATSVDNAVLYFKHEEKFMHGATGEKAYFMQWATGEKASRFWDEVKQRQSISSGEPHAVFLGVSGFNVREDAFYRALKNEMARHFPEIEEKVIKLCFDGTL